MIEIIYNPKLDPKYQYIALSTYTFDTLQVDSTSLFSTVPLLSIAASGGYFLMFQQDQASVVGLVSCDY
jgi:hypothetical protein